MSAGDELRDQLLRAADRDVERIANELLREFAGGYSIDRLVPVLRSTDPRIAATGAWILAELGRRALSLLPELDRLLDHPSHLARFHALDCVLVCAGESDGALMAKALGLVDDEHEAVRWKAIFVLGRASVSQLAAAQQFATEEQALGLQFLLGKAGSLGSEATSSPVLSRYQLAAAVRAPDDAELQRMAESGPDEEIRRLAKEELESRRALR